MICVSPANLSPCISCRRPTSSVRIACVGISHIDLCDHCVAALVHGIKATGWTHEPMIASKDFSLFDAVLESA